MQLIRSLKLVALLAVALWSCALVAGASASAQHHHRRHAHRASAKCATRHAKRGRHKAHKHHKSSHPSARCAKHHSRRHGHVIGLAKHPTAPANTAPVNREPKITRRDSHRAMGHHRGSLRGLSVRGANAGYSSPPPTPAPSGGCPDAYLMPAPGDLERIRKATLCLINEEREAHGEHALQFNGELESAAQGHTEDMVSGDYFEHVAPTGSTPSERIKASGYVPSSRDGYSIGENIAWGSLQLATPKAIVNAWMNSPGHRANILNAQFRDTGIGVVANLPNELSHQEGAIYTEDFGVIIHG